MRINFSLLIALAVCFAFTPDYVFASTPKHEVFATVDGKEYLSTEHDELMYGFGTCHNYKKGTPTCFYTSTLTMDDKGNYFIVSSKLLDKDFGENANYEVVNISALSDDYKSKKDDKTHFAVIEDCVWNQGNDAPDANHNIFALVKISYETRIVIETLQVWLFDPEYEYLLQPNPDLVECQV